VVKISLQLSFTSPSSNDGIGEVSYFPSSDRKTFTHTLHLNFDRHWAWTQFTKTIPLSSDVREKLKNGEKVDLDIVSKAMDSSFNLQPERKEPYWNARGVCINHWYHVNTKLDPMMEKGTLSHQEDIEPEFHNTPSGGSFAKTWGRSGWTLDPKHQRNPRDTTAPESNHF